MWVHVHFSSKVHPLQIRLIRPKSNYFINWLHKHPLYEFKPVSSDLSIHTNNTPEKLSQMLSPYTLSENFNTGRLSVFCVCVCPLSFEMSAMSVKMGNENSFEGCDIFIGFSYNFILNVRSVRSSK